MNSTREQMLQRIRDAVIEGNRAGAGATEIPERGQVGYQGAGADPLARFGAELTAAGGHLHVVPDAAAAMNTIMNLVRARSVRRVLLGRGDALDALPIGESLRAAGIEVVDAMQGGGDGKEWFLAELGLSGVDYLIAETGSVVLASRPEQPRSLSLLPPIHIAVAERRQLLPDLFDLFAALGTRLVDLPSGLSIVTGPSKTGDIELRLVTGVHGPGEIHVVLIGEAGQIR
ncbi:MAG: LutC/YkgG family protein [Gemmataceae bacterium]